LDDFVNLFVDFDNLRWSALAQCQSLSWREKKSGLVWLSGEVEVCVCVYVCTCAIRRRSSNHTEA
jgi:hypothetical protein